MSTEVSKRVACVRMWVLDRYPGVNRIYTLGHIVLQDIGGHIGIMVLIPREILLHQLIRHRCFRMCNIGLGVRGLVA